MRFQIFVACIASALLLAYVIKIEFMDEDVSAPVIPALQGATTLPIPQNEVATHVQLEPVAIELFQGDIIKTKGPVNYFVSKCSTCHGAEDMSYKQIKTPKRGDALKQMIRTMAAGPAMAPIGAADVEKQFDLHNAMLDNMPYAWLGEAQADVMPGETITGTEIVLQTKDKQYKANVSGYRFTLPNLEGELILKRNDKEVRQPTGPR